MDLSTGPEVPASGKGPSHALYTAGRTHGSSLNASKKVSDIRHPPDTVQQLSSTETSKMEVPASHVGRPSKPSIADSTTQRVVLSAILGFEEPRGTIWGTSVTEDSDRTTGLPPDDSGYGPSLWTGELGTRDGSRTVAPGTGRYNYGGKYGKKL